MPLQIAVSGPSHCTATDAQSAYRVGELLARAGATVLCGGGAGVMAAVARGARAHDGLVIGIRPDDDRTNISPDLSATVMTNMGEARNAILVRSADSVIVIGGSWGTLSELALAMRRGGIPVITLGGWTILDKSGQPVPGMQKVNTPEEAAEAALALCTDNPHPLC